MTSDFKHCLQQELGPHPTLELEVTLRWTQIDFKFYFKFFFVLAFCHHLVSLFFFLFSFFLVQFLYSRLGGYFCLKFFFYFDF
jgi:hypothetical protein